MDSFFNSSRLAGELELFVGFTLLSFIPLFLIAATTFTRNIIVLSMLRHALGLQQTPPNIVLIVLAGFIAFSSMSKVFEQGYKEGVQPYLDKSLTAQVAIEKTWAPFKNFMLSQASEDDLEFVYRVSNVPPPDSIHDIGWQQLIPAFMVSELKTAFKLGFVIFLPFLLVDLIVAAVLTSLGMIMVPPVSISMPLKIMLFVVVDGWSLIAETLLKSASG